MIQAMEYLRLNGIEVREAIQRFIALITKRRYGQRIQIKQLSVWWMLIWQNQVFEADRVRELYAEPTIADDTNDVLWRQWFKDGNGEDDLLFLAEFDHLLLQVEVLVVVDVVVEGVLDPDPERLRHSVDLIIPYEAWFKGDFDTKDGTCDWMQGCVDFHVW